MPGKQAKVVTPPMLKRMLRRVSHSSFPARDRAMILLSVKAGLRACEIAGLDWSMVLDAQGHVSGTIHVRDLIAKKRGGRRLDASRPAARLGTVGAHHGTDRAGDPPLSRRALKANSVVNWFVALFKALGYEGCSSHSGRRSFITIAARNVHRSGCSLRDVQLLAGHRYRDDGALHRRRHLRAEAIGCIPLGAVAPSEAYRSGGAHRSTPLRIRTQSGRGLNEAAITAGR